MENETHKKQSLVGNIGEKVGWRAYLILFFAILFFSGIAASWGQSSGQDWIKILDFSELNGGFGKMKIPEKSDFQGQGGFGAKAGFLLAFSLIPTVMFALGFIEVVEHYGGLRAAQKILNPLLRPLLGIPGLTGLALISSLQSTDGGSGMTKALFDEGLITEKERTIFSAFQFTAGGAIPNYINVASALTAGLIVPFLLPLLVIFFFKFLGANLIRFYLTYFVKEVE